ncbi:MAG: c-type cytochrome [bacterium]|nr:c-type cytochrome [bacterium]
MRPIQIIIVIFVFFCLSCTKTGSATPAPSSQSSSATEENLEAVESSVVTEESDLPFDPTVGLDLGKADAGSEYFYGENRGRCLACHKLGGEGFADGWALDDTGLRRNPEWLARWIDNPRNIHPEVVIMPPWRGDSAGATIADVVAFLMTLQTEVDHPATTDIKPDNEPEPNHDGIAGSEGAHGRY